MNQEFRLILAVVLCGIVYMGYQFLFPAPPVTTQETTQTVLNTQTKTEVAEKQIEEQKQQEITQLQNNQIIEEETNELKAIEKKIVVNTKTGVVVLSTRGAKLTGYELANYKLEAKEDSPNKNLLKVNGHDSTALYLGFKGYSGLTDKKVYEVVSDNNLNEDQREIVLAWYNDFIKVTKTFLFDGTQKEYAINVSYKVENLSQINMTLRPYLQNKIAQKLIPEKKGGFLSFFKFERPDVYGLSYLNDKDLTHDENWAKFTGERLSSGKVYWSGIADRYFMFALLPEASQVGSILTKFIRQDDYMVNELYNKEVDVAPGQNIKGSFTAYIGPKIMDNLAKISPELKRAVDYGWFSILAWPILWLMSFLHKFIPSWGVTIIALTFIVKLLLHPFNKKSMQSMKAMQNLQPKMQEIKKKFADDKQKQNEEVMQLFKTHKVNPMGGCLPLLLQFPVYIALYKVLWNAIELYHAPFMYVYKDLSAPDPYYVSPVLLGVFMFLQQKLTPTASTDPAQQKMMMFMPVMFTVFMLFLPVGLVIYIFVNTVMSVVQQYMIKHDLTFKDIIHGKFKPTAAA